MSVTLIATISLRFLMASSMLLWVAVPGYILLGMETSRIRALFGFSKTFVPEAPLTDESRTVDSIVPHLRTSSADQGGREVIYDNFGHQWPRAARPVKNPRHNIIKEDHVRSRFIYESPGYVFHADSPISYEASLHFATLFETTREYLKSLPIGLLRTDEETRKSVVFIFGTDEAYRKSGGLPGTAGCYLPGKRFVLVPVSSLEFRNTDQGIVRDQQRDYKVLIHELTHQLTPSAYYAHGSVGWFSEGLAEYVGATPYRPGYFAVDRYGASMKEYVCGFGEDGKGGRNLGTEISILPLKDFMLMSYDRFCSADPNRNYGAALLITYYFFHMEGGGGAERITMFLQGLRAGRYGETALAALHGGEGFAKLQADISDAWARQGIKLTFGGR